MTKVHSNYHKRDLQYFWWLTEEQQEQVRDDYDYLFKDDALVTYTDVENFVYKGYVYCMDSFLWTKHPMWSPNPPDWLKEWDGYLNDSFFSGIVIRYPKDDCGEDTEHIIVGTFY